MRKRDRAREHDGSERRRPGEPPPRSDVAETMLALQRSAGNQAVSALVARSPAGDEKESAKGGGARATLADIGTIQLLSVSFPTSAPAGTGRSADREQGEPTVRELVLTSRAGEHSPKLARAASDGKTMEVEVIVSGRKAMRLKLTGAVVSSYQMSGGGQPEEIETWTLDFQAIEQTFEEGEGAKR
jgi:type VI protein secretion system component Hcp